MKMKRDLTRNEKEISGFNVYFKRVYDLISPDKNVTLISSHWGCAVINF